MKYTIKSTGIGKQTELVKALRYLADAIENSKEPILDGARWEDETLMTEIDCIYE